MKILAVASSQNSINFRRHLSSAEEKEMAQINAQAKEILGNTGNSVLLVHDACLPQSAPKNTGVANILNNESQNFFDFAKTYFGINTIEVFPQGEYVRKTKSGLVCAYSYSALGLNDSLIDSESLTSNHWHHILSKKEFKEIVDANRAKSRITTVNYENINSKNSVFDRNMRKAYCRFLALDSSDELRQNFERFKLENAGWLTPKAVYHIIKKENNGKDWEQWQSSLDKQLYHSRSAYSQSERQARINGVLSEHRSEADFYKFKQFVAEKHLQEGRELLHEKGLKLFGDMPIKFSKDEMWANPEAFLFDYHVGANDWRASCLNYYALRDENSAASNLLKLKASLAARRYDGTRVDVAWMYVKPKMIKNSTGEVERIDLGDSALKLISDEFERVQGPRFSAQNIIHEFKAGSEDFSMFSGGTLRSDISSRVAILESEHLSKSWGHYDYYFKTLGMSADSGILGVGDHTSQPLAQIAAGMRDSVASAKEGNDVVRIKTQAPVLAELFGDSVENMMKPAEFIRAKFADIMSAKHNFVFYMDAFGRTSRFDSQGLNGRENYRYKIPNEFKEQYHQAVQKGFALNLSDTLAEAFERAGLDKNYPKLYEKLCEYAKKLKEKDAKEFIVKFENHSNNVDWKKLGIIGTSACAVTGLALALCGYINGKKQSN